MFLNEDDLSCGFCEFNGDGSAGMNENREITNSITSTETFKRFSQIHQVEPCELFESWVLKFIDISNAQITIPLKHVSLSAIIWNVEL